MRRVIHPGEVFLENGDKAKCPKCGSESFVKCSYEGEGGGATKFLDQYTGVCESCGTVVHALVNGGDVGQSEWITDCPFCGRPSYSHRG